jgi:hypothetical protein
MFFSDEDFSKMSFKLMRRGMTTEQQTLNAKGKIADQPNNGCAHLPFVLGGGFGGASPAKAYSTLRTSPPKNVFRRELASPSKEVLRRELRASPGKDIFRRELSGKSESQPARRASVDATAIPSGSRRSSLKPTIIEEKNDERGFLDRAFESAFTFDVEEP